MPYLIDEEKSDVVFEVDGTNVAFKVPNGKISGSDIYLIKKDDATSPTDTNTYSASAISELFAKKTDLSKSDALTKLFEPIYDTNGNLISIKALYDFYSVGSVTAYGKNDSKPDTGSVSSLSDVILTSLTKGDELRYNGTHWINVHPTDGLVDENGIITETPEEWKARVPVSSRREGMEVMLRTNSTDSTYTRYKLTGGVSDDCLAPIEYFVSMAPYLVQVIEATDTDKAPSAHLFNKIFNEYIMNINGGDY